MAAVFAAKGHDVIGLDVNASAVAELNAGRAPVLEPKLQEMIDAGRTRLRATLDDDELVSGSDTTFIVVPTPSDEQGAFSNNYVIAAIERLGRALARKASYHVVTVTSTVMPGAMEGVVQGALERACGRRIGQDLGLCYNPEFIALGSVVDNMLEPDFLLIGESDPRAGDAVAALYEPVCAKHPPVRRMNFVNAELAKISINTFVTTKISYANMLADVCDRLPGADVDIVAGAVGSDSRIGHKYLRGAIGYGGPCFPRDNIAFSTLATRVGAHADIAGATDAINRYQIERLTDTVTALVPAGARVAILGMAYKPDTTTIEESQGIMLAQRLRGRGYVVGIHDPLAAHAAARMLGPDFAVHGSAEALLRESDIAVMTTPWPEYGCLDLGALVRRIPIIDCWRILPRAAGDHVDVVWLGYGERRIASTLS
jgi:UDPglucose 6-dehydrogenase